ncbi:Fe-S oxidoreductase [Desulfosporosinus orientis DSM 765]|uniref:Fe-S oxidoreductase n=1 Tax=Desulfosporosinus orientis (strain ATCC 19365 / DSM 765 / NCIMB 8382 / VKM B-1628 / Singapore I) TaxID=768706 RepID=G7WJ96_DESOD|nr:(Fe-S)-binding protein [Desulfosporosinus orientis]AET69755.1 Fe-S oxidoreductase [Desulfosporosinus orientis DSM 765]
MKTLEELREQIAKTSYICGSCGSCRSVCPVYREIGWESSAPRRKIALAKEIFLKKKEQQTTGQYAQRLQECTLCGKCAEICAAGIKTRELWLKLREDLRARGMEHQNLSQMALQVKATHNISTFPNENRLDWAEDLDEFEVEACKAGSEVAYFVGCVSSFYPMSVGISQSIVSLLDRANVSYTVLGSEEWCCGFPLLAAGNSHQVTELAKHNVEKVRTLGVKTLITGCASCYHTWTHEYPAILGGSLGFEVLHATQYLAGLVRTGQLEPGSLDETVTYHDPCDLGRNSGIYDEPRELLLAIEGVDFVEMPHRREMADCCGGGGNLAAVDKELSQGIAVQRVREAAAAGATILTSACQQCVQTLQMAARQEKLPLEVLDVTELLWRSLEE